MNITAPLRRSLLLNALALRIARHYLFSRERRALEWMVTLISLAGVAIGVGTIITVFAVIAGMERKEFADITSMIPSLNIYNEAWYKQDPAPGVLGAIRRDPAVALTEPMLSHGTAIQVEGVGRRFVRIYAVDALGANNFFNVVLPKGAPPLKPAPGHLFVSDVVSTMPLAGRAVKVVSNAKIKTPLFVVPKQVPMTVQGTFKLENRFFGDYMAFATWDDVRALTCLPGGIQTIDVKLTDPMDAQAVKARLLERLPPGTKIETWIDHFEKLFTALSTVKLGMLAIMAMTIVVAALNIIGTLTLIVIQKTREIGILRAMGASRRLVGRVFLAEGTLVGVIGSVLGVALGLGVCGLIHYYKIPMPGGAFACREIPVELNWTVAALTPLGAVAVCTLAALAPAWRAGGLNPVEALRHE